MENVIKIRGARQHNLKNIDLDIPKNRLVVFTGISGSGKSSLAFDTIYAEGQRRYVESLSAYARQFLGIMGKPDVDLIEGLSPAISIDQKTTSRNPRSTVGTVTEVYDYLRLLFARIGHPHCPICGREIEHQSAEQVSEKIFELIKNKLRQEKKARIIIFSRVVQDRKGEFSSLFSNLKAKGYSKVRVDSKIFDLDKELVLIKTNKHTIDVVIDRLSLSHADLKDEVFQDSLKSRIHDSTEQALGLSDGLLVVSEINDAGFDIPQNPTQLSDHLFSERFACPTDNIQIPEIEPRTFSFNSPHGACPTCTGIGKILKIEPNLLFSGQLSILEGGILPFSTMFEKDTWYSRLIKTVCSQNGIDLKIPIRDLPEDKIDIILNGTGERVYEVEGTNRFGRITRIWETFSGIVKELERRHTSTDSDYIRAGIERFMREIICPICKGTRLKKEALGVTISDLSISDVTKKSVSQVSEWIESLENGEILTPRERQIAKLIIKELIARLSFLNAVGVEYLTLDRGSGTLAGGEAQRIRLASQIGTGLTGVLYVLDEPTIGLHPRDSGKLINTLKKLKDLGNTVIVVEHDRDVMKSADYVVDFGPGAGKFGGQIVSLGSVEKIIKNPKSLTGQYLSGKKKIIVRPSDSWINTQDINSNKSLKLMGASQYNLKNVNLMIPLGKFIAVTGVSGSGKSTLIVETLYKAIKQMLNPFSKEIAGVYRNIAGAEYLDKVILIDQSPIGRTPRSNPATYTKLFDLIRVVFSSTREARARGFKPGRFSFNVKGGRCEACEGQGQTKIEMQFMADIWVTCEVCEGKRYNSQTLEVNYRGKNISEVLQMTVNEAKEYFHSHGPIIRKIETLEDVGLGYIELGQPATTLSGGEAQRIKLAAELGKVLSGSTLYILDEPTTGLHFADLEKLLKVLRTLVDRGNTVIVIEHNLDVIRNVDWVIDLGPEGGELGGEIIATGTPDQLAKYQSSYTGSFLKK